MREFIKFLDPVTDDYVQSFEQLTFRKLNIKLNKEFGYNLFSRKKRKFRKRVVCKGKMEHDPSNKMENNQYNVGSLMKIVKDL